jgi:hypothetical protein
MSIKQFSGFKNKLYIIYAVFGFLILFFSLSLIFDGPRVRKVEFDQNKLTKQTNQTVVLRLNQPIKTVEKSQIRFNPSVEFTVANSGESIVLQLKQRLDYEEKYTLEIRDVQADNGKKSYFKTEIETPSATYTYLKRGGLFSRDSATNQKQPDQIIRGSINGDDEVVYSSYQIIEYARIGENFVINQTNELGDQTVVLYNEQTEESVEVPLPDIGEVQNLRASPSKDLIGFTFTSDKQSGGLKDYQQRLFVYDINAGVLAPVRGIADDYIDTSDWKFSPDGSTVIASTYKTGMTLIDTYSKNDPIPLGSYYEIGNFSRTGSKVVLSANYDGPIVFDILESKRFEPKANAVDGITPYLSETMLLQNSDRLLSKVQIIESGGTILSTAIILSKEDADQKTIYEVDYKQTDVSGYSASGNDQYVAVETSNITADRAFDIYPENSKPTNVQTKIISTENAQILKSMDGLMLIWE